VYRKVPITAEASLSRQLVEESPNLRSTLGGRMRPPDFEIACHRVEVRRLDDLQLEPAFVKVDVQGSEQPTLLGLKATLDAHGPPVLVESPSEETQLFMNSLGYEPYAYDHNTRRLRPLSGFATNALFARTVPPSARA
jgi:hypothetical protein